VRPNNQLALSLTLAKITPPPATAKTTSDKIPAEISLRRQRRLWKKKGSKTESKQGPEKHQQAVQPL